MCPNIPHDSLSVFLSLSPSLFFCMCLCLYICFLVQLFNLCVPQIFHMSPCPISLGPKPFAQLLSKFKTKRHNIEIHIKVQVQIQITVFMQIPNWREIPFSRIILLQPGDTWFNQIMLLKVGRHLIIGINPLDIILSITSGRLSPHYWIQSFDQLEFIMLTNWFRIEQIW